MVVTMYLIRDKSRGSEPVNPFDPHSVIIPYFVDRDDADGAAEVYEDRTGGEGSPEVMPVEIESNG